jgi:hypothetical protein
VQTTYVLSNIVKERGLMAGRTITVTLPEALYERVKETAEASSQSLEAVLAQPIALFLPALECELSPEVRAELTTAEQETLAQLMEAAQRIMLRKAETYRLLARRGYTVLASSDSSPG